MKPKISLIVAVYNIESYIEKCILSIKSQTYKNFECILVDDGSKDCGGKCCDKYASLDSRFKAIHKANGGLSSARNEGLKYITGDYIMFVDGDDFIDDSLLEGLVKVVEKTNCDTVFCGYKNVDVDGNLISTVIPKYEKDIYEETEINKLIAGFIGFSYDALYDRFIRGVKLGTNKVFASVWRFLYSTSVFKNEHLSFMEDVKFGEDIIFNPIYLASCKKMAIYRGAGYNYVFRSNGLLQSFLNDDGPKMLSHKIGLMHAREKITEIIKKQYGYDVWELWQGSIVLSAVQVGLAMTKKNEGYSFINRYRLFKTYVEDSVCIKAYKQLLVKDLPIKYKVVFIPIKFKMFSLSFLMFNVANKLKINTKL